MSKNWKSKLFGDNKLNFYGWLFAGLLIIFGSLFVALRAIKINNENIMLFAIYLVLIGIFCVLLQNYHARVAEKLEDKENIKSEPTD